MPTTQAANQAVAFLDRLNQMGSGNPSMRRNMPPLAKCSPLAHHYVQVALQHLADDDIERARDAVLRVQYEAQTALVQSGTGKGVRRTLAETLRVASMVAWRELTPCDGSPQTPWS